MKYSISQTRTGSEQSNKPLSFLELLQSTLWAAIGVQKSENRQRDFARGKAYQFVLMGIGYTAFFACLMAGIVHLVINVTAGN